MEYMLLLHVKRIECVVGLTAIQRRNLKLSDQVQISTMVEIETQSDKRG